MGKTDGEVFLELRNLVVNPSIFWNKSGFVQFYQRWFGSEIAHRIWMSHSDQSSFRQFSQNFEEYFLVVGKWSRVHSSDVATESWNDVMINLFGFVIFKLDDFGVPAEFFYWFHNWQSILSVTVWSFIVSSDGLEDNNSFSFFDCIVLGTGGSHEVEMSLDL